MDSAASRRIVGKVVDTRREARKQLVELTDKKYGHESIQRLGNLVWLEEIYRKEGKDGEAEATFDQRLAVTQQKTKDEDRALLEMLAYHSEVLRNYPAAERFWTRVLAMDERNPSLDDLWVWEDCRRLARLYDIDRKDSDAEGIYERAVQISEKHGDTGVHVESLSDLASFYQSRGRGKRNRTAPEASVGYS
jgi:tetratricopeptide (TPR) repeat protein